MASHLPGRELRTFRFTDCYSNIRAKDMVRFILQKNRALLRQTFLAATLLVTWGAALHAQENIMKAEKVFAGFFSETPVENIEAHNKDGQGVLDVITGELLFVVPIRQFEFEKSLMQKHFNKNYMESDKYPEATFKGRIVDWEGLPSSARNYRVEGTLNIHGVDREVTEKASLVPSEAGLRGESTFTVLLTDYDIKVPKLVVKKIAEEIEVRIRADFK
jgi:hypothetical protein